MQIAQRLAQPQPLSPAALSPAAVAHTALCLSSLQLVLLLVLLSGLRILVLLPKVPPPSAPQLLLLASSTASVGTLWSGPLLLAASSGEEAVGLTTVGEIEAAALSSSKWMLLFLVHVPDRVTRLPLAAGFAATAAHQSPSSRVLLLPLLSRLLLLPVAVAPTAVPTAVDVSWAGLPSATLICSCSSGNAASSRVPRGGGASKACTSTEAAERETTEEAPPMEKLGLLSGAVLKLSVGTAAAAAAIREGCSSRRCRRW